MEENRHFDPQCKDLAVLDSCREQLIGVVATLVAFGVVLVYSASSVRAYHFGWEMKYLANQLQWLAVGVVGFMIASRINYRRLERWWIPAFLLTLSLLVAVRTPGVGTKVRGAYRWLRFGGFNMQPSELAKVGLVIVVAALLARSRDGKLGFWKNVVPVIGVIGIAAGLIVIEPDFGTAALISTVLLGMLIAGGAKFWHIGIMIVAGVPPVVFYGITRFNHINERVAAWLSGSNSGAGWQPWMSKVALGSGGLTGEGLGQGTAKLYYLPDAHTDFIMAIAGQELGLAGTLSIVCLFVYFVYLGFKISSHAQDRFGSLLAFGIVSMIGLQAAFNMAVVTASIPPKGISLPFVSFGGSGLCVALAATGLLVSVTRAKGAKVAEAIAFSDEEEFAAEAA
ncbi:MAG: cell division protein FtsW [Planctomycetes bacterium]|nr:cell division protein FtsW [Planctomycetota bacterium]